MSHSLQWIVYIIIAIALKDPSLKLFNSFIDGRNVYMVLLQRSLTEFSCFCEHSAACLRLQLESHIEILSLARSWPLDHRSKQCLPIVPIKSSRNGLNLESLKARKSVHPCTYIDQGASHQNIILLRWSSGDVQHHIGISCFAGSLEVWEKYRSMLFYVLSVSSPFSRNYGPISSFLDILHQT